jgi:hypothetical protein
MKKFIFLALLALVWPVATDAQSEVDNFEFFQAQEEFDSSITIGKDTMSIQEAIKFRNECFGTAEFFSYSDFVITKTESAYGEGFRQGLYFKDGIVVDLPINFNPNFLQVNERNGDLFLKYFTEDKNGGISIFTISLPHLPSMVSVPCEVTIEALYY